jgi:ribosomal protein S18 acetylase RimI-like enzyme
MKDPEEIVLATHEHAPDILPLMAMFGYDLEFAGRDAFITEIFVESASRGQGLGRRLLESTVQHLQQHSAHAVHLVVPT